MCMKTCKVCKPCPILVDDSDTPKSDVGVGSSRNRLPANCVEGEFTVD